MEQPGMGDCSSTNCCTAGIPGATKPDSAGPVSAARTTRVASCRNCGNDPQAITRAFKAGVQAAYWDTYAENVRAVAEREQREAERLNHWRYGE